MTQTYDIEFREPRWNKEGEKTENARVTVFRNGIMIHDNVEIPARTGGGKAGTPRPLPLRLQDHGQKVRFRNIWMAPIGDP